MSTPRERFDGILGRALAANVEGRLKHFITGETSPAIALFERTRAKKNLRGDWYGEHAGKWLAAALKAAARTGDAALAASVRRVADYLVSVQEADGYLGTYAPSRRFMHRQPPSPPSWNGEPVPRTWDLWTHACMLQGLLQVHAHFPDTRYLGAARAIGDLCERTLIDERVEVTHLGNHHGLSATVLTDAVMDLHFATGESRYLELARHIVERAEARAELRLLSRSLAGADVHDIATGKAYQILWNMVGLAKLHRATRDARYLAAATNAWRSVRQHHLTLGGGPWGGIAQRSREVFNPAGYFSPFGYVETCSTLAWIQLNRELLGITGEAPYAEEIERAAYNDLIGAQAPNGEDWCYYSFPNGRRVFTTYWRCCKSSGALALEELPALACTVTADNEVSVNIYGPCVLERVGLRLEQSTTYPAEGDIRIRVSSAEPAERVLRLRIPSWARGATIQLDGDAQPAAPGTYVALKRRWQASDEVKLHFPMGPMLHRQSSRNVQESVGPDGEPIQQEVLRHDYVAITRGPLVYATSLIDGFKREETLQLPANPDLEMAPAAPGRDGPAIRLTPDHRAPLLFVPYYEAGGREDGAWRLTWMTVAHP